MFKYLYGLLLIVLTASCSTPPSNLCPNNENFIEAYNTPNNFIGPGAELKAFNDYEMGLACAQRQNKPIFVLFTGFGSRINYIGDILLQEKSVLNLLNEYFIPIILYVDDRTKLSEPQSIEGADGETIQLRNIGNVNAHLQEVLFHRQSQPYMAFINWQEQELAHPIGYSPNADQLVQQLKEAVNFFYKKQR